MGREESSGYFDQMWVWEHEHTELRTDKEREVETSKQGSQAGACEHSATLGKARERELLGLLVREGWECKLRNCSMCSWFLLHLEKQDLVHSFSINEIASKRIPGYANLLRHVYTTKLHRPNVHRHTCACLRFAPCIGGVHPHQECLYRLDCPCRAL